MRRGEDKIEMREATLRGIQESKDNQGWDGRKGRGDRKLLGEGEKRGHGKAGGGGREGGRENSWTRGRKERSWKRRRRVPPLVRDVHL